MSRSPYWPRGLSPIRGISAANRKDETQAAHIARLKAELARRKESEERTDARLLKSSQAANRFKEEHDAAREDLAEKDKDFLWLARNGVDHEWAEDVIGFSAYDGNDEDWRIRVRRARTNHEEMLRPTPSPEPDIDKCPGCGGEADNGHDRMHPPNPYFCSRCEPEPED